MDALLALRPGDELVISTHGYGSAAMALRYCAARAGAQVIEAVYAVGAADAAITSACAAACSARTRPGGGRVTAPAATVIPVAAVAAAVAGPGRSVLAGRGARARPAGRRHRRIRRRPLDRGTCTSGRTPLAAARSCGAGPAPR